jgi:hypothetical protein
MRSVGASERRPKHLVTELPKLLGELRARGNQEAAMNDTHLGAELLELLGELRPRHLEWRDCKVRAVLAPSQKVALGHAVIEEHGRVFGADGTADKVHIDRVRNRRHSEEAINRQSIGNQ